MKRYKVVGDCVVAGVKPGEIVTSKQLEAAKANVPPLLGYHLELVADEPKPEPKNRARGR